MALSFFQEVFRDWTQGAPRVQCGYAGQFEKNLIPDQAIQKPATKKRALDLLNIAGKR